jgi:uncharacterized protein (UPF0332 family)
VLTGIFEKELGKNLAHAKAARETYEYTIATVLKPEAEAILRNAQNFVKTVKKYLEKTGVLVGAMH